MLSYSDEGLAARPTFFAHYNDIIIIVEDEGKENFYTEVIKRLLGDNPKITKVLGIGGKRQVFKRFEERNASSNRWQEFYIVDGDFDDLLGRESPDSLWFYRLRRYDIESYLVEDAAVCTVAEEESPHFSATKYRELLSLKSWLEEVINLVVRLVACAALLQELEETQFGISQSIERYVMGDSVLPDAVCIDSHIDQVKASQSVVQSQEFDLLLGHMTKRMGESSFEHGRWVSGKDILIPLLIRLLRQNIGSSLRKESLCFRLARNCEFTELAELRERILAAVIRC